MILDILLQEKNKYMAQYNVSKPEAKRLGIERVLISGSTKDVKDIDSAKSYINGNQLNDAASVSASDPEIRASVKKYGSLASEITGVSMQDIKAPELPKFEESYKGLRGEYGVDELEASLGELQSQADSIKTQFYMDKNAEKGKGGLITGNVVEGRVGEHEQAANERLMILNDQIQTVNSQLTNSYKVIGDIMNFKGLDYNAANDQYKTQYSQQIAAMNMVQGIEQDIKDEKQKLVDNARANLNIMYNNIAENSDGYKSLSSSQKSSISKLEAQAGLPQGFYKTIESKNPGGKIITTKSWSDASGKEYVSTITQGKDGELKTNNLYVGQGKAQSSSLTEKESFTVSKQKMSSVLKSVAGPDGYISPGDWNDALNEWTQNTAYSRDQFYDAFRGLVNPTHPQDYAGYDKKTKKFI